MTGRWFLLGQSVDCPLELPGSHPTDIAAGVSVDFSWPFPQTAISGVNQRLIARFARDGIVYYELFRLDSGYYLPVDGLAEFFIDAHGTLVHCRPIEGCAPELIAVLISGIVMAFVHTLQGRCVLHASAVRSAGLSVAFMGGSGRGKSTLAAPACSGGAELISDDVLPVCVRTGRLTSVGTVSEIRLRTGASHIAGSSSSLASRTTIDGRTALRCPSVQNLPVDIDSIVLPVIGERTSRVTLVRIRPSEAVAALISGLRIAWCDPEWVNRHFDFASTVAASVPIFVATLPAGPPFRTEVADQVLESVREWLQQET